MTKYKAAVFDLDGTLLNTLDDLALAVNLTMERYGVPRRTLSEVRDFVGDGAAKLIERAMPFNTNSSVLDEATNLYKKLYIENMTRKTGPYPGIKDMLNKLAERGIKTAVVSNKFYRSTQTLCKKFFPEIEYAVGEDEKNGVRRKPNPDMLIEAMKRLETSPDETLFIGDSEVDVQTAASANVDCMSVLWGFCDEDFLRENGASHFAAVPSDILNFIDADRR